MLEIKLHMNFRYELFLRPLECYFGVYFPSHNTKWLAVPTITWLFLIRVQRLLKCCFIRKHPLSLGFCVIEFTHCNILHSWIRHQFDLDIEFSKLNFNIITQNVLPIMEISIRLRDGHRRKETCCLQTAKQLHNLYHILEIHITNKSPVRSH